MENTIDNARQWLIDHKVRDDDFMDSGMLSFITMMCVNYAASLQSSTVIQDETASLRSEIASLRSRLDDCKRKVITGERG